VLVGPLCSLDVILGSSM